MSVIVLDKRTCTVQSACKFCLSAGLVTLARSCLKGFRKSPWEGSLNPTLEAECRFVTDMVIVIIVVVDAGGGTPTPPKNTFALLLHFWMFYAIWNPFHFSETDQIFFLHHHVFIYFCFLFLFLFFPECRTCLLKWVASTLIGALFGIRLKYLQRLLQKTWLIVKTELKLRIRPFLVAIYVR